jgi:heme/copper-type cytochrome/quinol oxidase subunit 2
MRVVIVAALAWAAVGCITGFLAPVLAQSVDGIVDLGVLATLRTGVLAAATLLIAWGARHDRLREWAWLVYPMLVLIGLKMVAQDFKHSRPATLFIALALYGIALILAPRLRRGRGQSTLTGGPGHAAA